jgi:hypothetical protein
LDFQEFWEDPIWVDSVAKRNWQQPSCGKNEIKANRIHGFWNRFLIKSNIDFTLHILHGLGRVDDLMMQEPAHFLACSYSCPHRRLHLCLISSPVALMLTTLAVLNGKKGFRSTG